MENILKNIIYKYTNIEIKREDDNLLDYPILGEYWLYIILELEELYNISIIKFLNEVDCEEFTLRCLNSRLFLTV